MQLLGRLSYCALLRLTRWSCAMQERIIAEEYIAPNGEGEHFKATLFIVMCNRLVTCAVAISLLSTSGQSILPQAPIWNYAAVSGNYHALDDSLSFIIRCHS
jgi:hypothetical protein